MSVSRRNGLYPKPGAFEGSRSDAEIERQFAQQMLTVQSYLTGSTTNEVPYEVVYCLKDALRRWDRRPTAIVTHITEGHNFHFVPADPWTFIKKALTGFDSSGFDLLLVMIGVPRLYAHKPIFCIPLYHELGHFVDLANGISATSLLIDRAPSGPPGSIEFRHRGEYFADLFAATFVGRSSIAALESIAPNDPASPTHPSTSDRVSLVEAYLNGAPHRLITTLTSAVVARGLPALRPIFTPVEVADHFDDLRTFMPANTEEIHGMFDSAWTYLFSTIETGRNPWNYEHLTEGHVETIANDLTEKSIRNFAVQAAWDEASSA